jgi:hypothetical protein
MIKTIIGFSNIFFSMLMIIMFIVFYSKIGKNESDKMFIYYLFLGTIFIFIVTHLRFQWKYYKTMDNKFMYISFFMGCLFSLFTIWIYLH